MLGVEYYIYQQGTERETEMMKTQRIKGRMVRTAVRLDRAWKAEGKVEGKTENALAWRLGIAMRAGVTGSQLTRARRANG